MSMKDLFARLTGRQSAAADGSVRPDGGTSCYRPIRRKGSDETQYAREKAAEYAAQDWQIPYAHTGFTDMNPPMDYGYAPDGWPTSSGYTSAGQDNIQRQNTAGRGYIPAQPRENISYMPGTYAPQEPFTADSGNGFSHVEHIMVMTSLKSCYDAIECMKNGETLIVVLDAIANDGEAARCQDMLAGAAFTLGCSVRMLQGARLVLIAPPGVQVLPEQHQRQRPEQPVTYGTEQPQEPVQEKPAGFRRERRVSENAAGWNNGNETYGYNPYTGTMPAAAGSFGNYGGYGY